MFLNLKISMWSSPFFSRWSIVSLLYFLSSVPAQSIPGATFFAGSGAPGAGTYRLVDEYEAVNFFNKFNFYSSYDPTYGHVQYVDESIAVQNGFVQTSDDNTAIIKPDTTNVWPNGGPGRPSVRIISDNTYTHGLFILDVKHMPYGCGTWPAYWLLGPNWPYNGEIDIIEGVNTIAYNSVSMHTNAGCTITGSDQTGSFQTSDCNEADNGNSGCGTQLNDTLTPDNYGDALNNIGGGVYATEWTSDYVQTWWFPRGSIPSSITSGAPNVSQFGEPAVNAQGGCDIDSHFNNMSIIINIDFCGAWAGEVYLYEYPSCPQNATAYNTSDPSLNSCVDFVGNNPQAFVDAYWEINSIRIYQMPNVATTSTYSTSLSSATPSASTNTINLGMGASTTSLSSLAYSGPLSSITSSSSVSSAPGSSATPAICPGSNNTIWTDYDNEQYTIACGSDYTGPGSGTPVTSFEACLELCDRSAGCLAASFLGGNIAGNCYLKDSPGTLNYDGATNAGVRVAGPVPSGSSSAAISTATSSLSSVSLMGASSSAVPTSSSSTISLAASSSSSATTTSAATCYNNTQVTDPLGFTYTEYCGLDTLGAGAFLTQNFLDGDFTQCRSLCDQTAGCGAWTWVPNTPNVCYLKHLPQSPGAGSPGFVAGILVASLSSSITASSSMTSSKATYSTISARSTPMSNPLASSSLSFSSSMHMATSTSTSKSVAPSSTSSMMSSTVVTSSTSSTSSLPSCEASDGPSALAGGACQDSYGNAFNVTSSGTQYTGTVSLRSAQPNINACLLQCDTTLGCIAVNYANGTCSLLSKVTGTTIVAGPSVVAATRPAYIITIYSTPAATPASTTTMPGSSSTAMYTSAGSVPTPACNSTFTDPINDQPWKVYCQADSSAASYETVSVNSGGFGVCFSACDGSAGCLGFTYVGGDTGNCYLKKSQGTLTPDPSNVYSCFKVLAFAGGAPSPPNNPSITGSSVNSAFQVTTPISNTPIFTADSSGGTGQSMSSTVKITTSQSATSGSPPIAKEPCPTSTTALCANSDQQTTCADSNGATYVLVCGTEYEGPVINTLGSKKLKRATEPNFQACQNLCDTTKGCVALNYIGTNCTLLSSVSGTTLVPGAVGASQVSPPATSVLASSSSTLAASPSNPVCPGSAGSMYTDSAGYVYGVGCYTDFAGNNIGTPISESSFSACLPYCDSMSGCMGVEYNFAYGFCYLKSSFTGIETSNTSVIYGMKNRAAPGFTSGAGTFTVMPSITSTLSLSSGATITVIPTTTVIFVVSAGGKLTGGASTTNPGPGALTGSGGASLCFTCALTPTVVTGGAGAGSGSGILSVSNNYAGMCSARSGVSTTTVFTTETITSCAPQPTCPASGYIIFGGGATQSGAIIVTTTNSQRSTIKYTQIPTMTKGPSISTATSSGDNNLGPGGSQGGSGGARGGTSVVTANGGQGGTTTLTISGSTIVTTGSTAVPRCPFNQGELFTDGMGMQYYIECNTLFTDTTIDTQTQSSLANCITACDMYNTMTFYTASQCLGVSYFSMQSTNNCLLKRGANGIYQQGVNSARLMTPYSGPGNGNGTGGSGGGLGPMSGGLASTLYGTMTVPSVTMYVTGGTPVTTVIGGSTIVSTFGGGTIVSTVSGGGGGATVTATGGGGGNGGGNGKTVITSVYGGSTYFSTYQTVAGATTVPEVSTVVSDGQTTLSTYGYSTMPGSTQYATATIVSGGTTQYITRTVTTSTISTTTTTVISYVPTTIYGTHTEVSTYISNGQTIVSTYVSVSVSISDQVQTVTGPGATVTASDQVYTVTEGGGEAITVTAAPQTVISYVYPNTSSSSFTCRTYATNYLNPLHGKVKKHKKRSIFDVDQLSGGVEKKPQPAARPRAWWHGY